MRTSSLSQGSPSAAHATRVGSSGLQPSPPRGCAQRAYGSAIVSILPLEARSIAKRFGGTVALRGVDLSIAARECVAIVGENGAGKSTLVRILAGVEQPDAGTVTLAGQDSRIASPAEARRLGICLINQDLQSVPNMTVAENIFLGHERSLHGLIQQHEDDESARQALIQLGIDVDLRRRMRTLSVAEAQLIEIARGLTQEADLLIMDEPTAALAAAEVERLFDVIRGLIARDKAVLYISHRIDEIRRVANRVVVLRDGAVAGALPASAESGQVITLMVGREIRDLYPRTDHTPGEAALEVTGLNAQGLADVTFSARGQHELAEILYGRTAVASGEIRIHGRAQPALSPARSIVAGIAFVAEDRRRDSLNLKANLQDNISLPVLRRFSRWGLLGTRSIALAVARLIRQFAIRAASPQQRVTELSGGNQQKVVLAKAMITEPSILILDEPTRGVDVGAKVDIYELLDRFAGEGRAVVMVSSDLDELRGMCDRMVVMYRGRIAGELSRDDATPEAVASLATGQGWAVA
ncbi:MAG: sugar ABC transporter ATP-binding protein [Chloroflexi bacterium]|nr:MAG: sugar ABC transporter ATP-binding protein [Chloroflexota bacterium]